MPDNSFRPIARNEGLVVQELADEILVFDLSTKRAHCLNSSAAFIWQRCDGKHSIDEIGRELALRGYGRVNNEFVWLGVTQLNDSNLLAQPASPEFSVLPRRDLLKQAALASSMVLPVAVSLAIPVNALAVASSCVCVNNATCTQPSRAVCLSITTCNVNGICAPN